MKNKKLKTPPPPGLKPAKSIFDVYAFIAEGQTYTPDSINVYAAGAFSEDCLCLWDVTRSQAWQRNGLHVGYVEGYFKWVGDLLMYGKYEIGDNGKLTWLSGPAPVDLELRDFQPCGIKVQRIKLL